MRAFLFLFLILFLCSCNQNIRNEENLVAYWSFNDTASAIIPVSGSTSMVVKNRGAKLADGFKGSALKFDGASVLEVNYLPVLDSFQKGITVAAWVKKDTSSTWNTILSREIDSTWSEYMGLAIFKNHALFSIDPDGKRYINVTDTGKLTENKWIHIAGTYNNDTLKLFVNSRYIGSAVCKGPIIFGDKNPLLIGGNSNDRNHSLVDCFNGYIDELRIYNIALNVNQIAELFKK
jgi:hypothetical protein